MAAGERLAFGAHAQNFHATPMVSRLLNSQCFVLVGTCTAVLSDAHLWGTDRAVSLCCMQQLQVGLLHLRLTSSGSPSGKGWCS
jgi:hypothetical protein